MPASGRDSPAGRGDGAARRLRTPKTGVPGPTGSTRWTGCVGWVGAHRRVAVAIYALLLALSHLTLALAPSAPAETPQFNRTEATIPRLDRAGPTGGEPVKISAIVFGADDTGSIPILLIHGSPGEATNFAALGPELAARGRRAYALDMPGFGLSSKWVPDYSARAYARAAIAFMDASGIERAHLVGWSNGGAVALNACDIASDRIASITLLAGIACQETEGSGDYFFEHAKYGVGYAMLVALPEALPHFGLLGDRSFRHAFIRNFWDTDQRPIRAIMESLETPTLILHGRHDPLVSDWAAERHHELIPTSRLVMTEHSHFLPFMQPALTAEYLEEHFTRHDTPGVAPRTDALILAPPAGQHWFRTAMSALRGTPWPIVAITLACLATLRRETATAAAGLCVGYSAVDFGVAFAGLLTGRFIAGSLEEDCPCRRGSHPLARALGTIVWTAVSLLVSQLLLRIASNTGELGIGLAFVSIVLVAALLHLLKRLPTRDGRRRLVVSVHKKLHHEWWPTWVLYGAIAPCFLRLIVKHRSLTVWTCVNPGIEPGGGIIGESKAEILKGLDPSDALRQLTIAPHADEADRFAALLERMRATDGLAFPVVVKPEAGERGDRVVVVRTPDALRAALASIPQTAIVQRYHPGPIELGVFWVRDPATVGRERTDATQGRVFAVTRKVFPDLVCDGVRTLRDQILAHPRYRMQASAYCTNLRDRLDRVPDAGEIVRLTELGNHIRGCRFEDGADLITPAFSEAIDRIARSWRGPNGEPFDYGRFDVRSASDDAVRAGVDLAIIELNGVTSEATNLYDPSWGPRRALALLGAQWSIAFELGAARRAVGGRPMRVRSIVRAVLTDG